MYVVVFHLTIICLTTSNSLQFQSTGQIDVDHPGLPKKIEPLPDTSHDSAVTASSNTNESNTLQDHNASDSSGAIITLQDLANRQKGQSGSGKGRSINKEFSKPDTYPAMKTPIELEEMVVPKNDLSHNENIVDLFTRPEFLSRFMKRGICLEVVNDSTSESPENVIAMHGMLSKLMPPGEVVNIRKQCQFKDIKSNAYHHQVWSDDKHKITALFLKKPYKNSDAFVALLNEFKKGNWERAADLLVHVLGCGGGGQNQLGTHGSSGGVRDAARYVLPHGQKMDTANLALVQAIMERNAVVEIFVGHEFMPEDYPIPQELMETNVAIEDLAVYTGLWKPCEKDDHAITIGTSSLPSLSNIFSKCSSVDQAYARALTAMHLKFHFQPFTAEEETIKKRRIEPRKEPGKDSVEWEWKRIRLSYTEDKYEKIRVMDPHPRCMGLDAKYAQTHEDLAVAFFSKDENIKAWCPDYIPVKKQVKEPQTQGEITAESVLHKADIRPAEDLLGDNAAKDPDSREGNLGGGNDVPAVGMDTASLTDGHDPNQLVEHCIVSPDNITAAQQLIQHCPNQSQEINHGAEKATVVGRTSRDMFQPTLEELLAAGARQSVAGFYRKEEKGLTPEKAKIIPLFGKSGEYKPLGFVLRSHHLPMASRPFDVTSSFAIESSGITQAGREFPNCNPDDPNDVPDRRWTVQEKTEIEFAHVAKFIILLRVTGRVGRLVDFMNWLNKKRDNNQAVPFAVGSKDDLAEFIIWVRKACESNTVRDIISPQFDGSLPIQLRNLEIFAGFVEDLAGEEGDELVNFLWRELALKEDATKTEGTRAKAVAKIREFIKPYYNQKDGNQEKILACSYFVAEQTTSDLDELFQNLFGPRTGLYHEGPGGKEGLSHIKRCLVNCGEIPARGLDDDQAANLVMQKIVDYVQKECAKDPVKDKLLACQGYRRRTKDGVVVNTKNGRPFDKGDAGGWGCEIAHRFHEVCSGTKSANVERSSKPHCWPLRRQSIFGPHDKACTMDAINTYEDMVRNKEFPQLTEQFMSKGERRCHKEGRLEEVLESIDNHSIAQVIEEEDSDEANVSDKKTTGKTKRSLTRLHSQEERARKRHRTRSRPGTRKRRRTRRSRSLASEGEDEYKLHSKVSHSPSAQRRSDRSRRACRNDVFSYRVQDDTDPDEDLDPSSVNDPAEEDYPGHTPPNLDGPEDAEVNLDPSSVNDPAEEEDYPGHAPPYLDAPEDAEVRVQYSEVYNRASNDSSHVASGQDAPSFEHLMMVESHGDLEGLYNNLGGVDVHSRMEGQFADDSTGLGRDTYQQNDESRPGELSSDYGGDLF